MAALIVVRREYNPKISFCSSDPTPRAILNRSVVAPFSGVARTWPAWLSMLAQCHLHTTRRSCGRLKGKQQLQIVAWLV